MVGCHIFSIRLRHLLVCNFRVCWLLGMRNVRHIFGGKFFPRIYFNRTSLLLSSWLFRSRCELWTTIDTRFIYSEVRGFWFDHLHVDCRVDWINYVTFATLRFQVYHFIVSNTVEQLLQYNANFSLSLSSTFAFGFFSSSILYAGNIIYLSSAHSIRIIIVKKWTIKIQKYIIFCHHQHHHSLPSIFEFIHLTKNGE